MIYGKGSIINRYNYTLMKEGYKWTTQKTY